MRNVLLLLLFIAVFAFTKVSFCINGGSFMFGLGLRGTGPVTTESRTANGFHAIDLDMSGD
ncbi:MAG TPA: hypothetical protein PK858_11650, partial [Saprospiraceae bacterium]|nr:hypothetical protein [Saprospiraceae bacterium]